MAGPLVSSCCRCQSLRTGSLISGVLGIVLAIVSLIVMFVARVDFKTIVFDWLPSSVVKIILAVNLCMTVLICLLMIVGVLKVCNDPRLLENQGVIMFAFQRNHYLMLPWVVLGIMLAVGLLISVVYTAIMLFIEKFVLAGCLWLVLGLLCVVVYTYMWVVTYSHFMVLKDESDRGRYAKQPYRR